MFFQFTVVLYDTERETLDEPEIIVRNPEIHRADGIMLTEKRYNLKMAVPSNVLLTQKGQLQGTGGALGNQTVIGWDKCGH